MIMEVVCRSPRERVPRCPGPRSTGTGTVKSRKDEDSSNENEPGATLRAAYLGQSRLRPLRRPCWHAYLVLSRHLPLCENSGRC
jgi:hypothetical protein